MRLKHTVETVFRVNAASLENLIDEVYGSNGFSIVADQEGSNYCHLRMVVDDEDLKYDWDKRKLAEFHEDKGENYVLDVVMNELCQNGIIDPGIYYIDISW